ncbi:MAG: repair protein RecN [Acidobacteria bacterium]|nr:repair protein RecN [Acidobacteriota bacterium]
MLRSLHVRNLAVLAGGEIELGAGLNVLTGETGAGKSLVVDSLGLLAGARAAADLVREGEEALSVAGLFDLPPGAAALLDGAGIEVDGDELVVRREISREGRNRVFLNDQPATVRLLQELAPRLLRIHGQREELGLADPELQRAWLDRAGGEEARTLAGATAERWSAWRALAERLERLAGDQRLRRERVDLLRFQASEIDDARLTPGEEDELRRDRDVLRHREAILAALGGAHGALVEDEGAAVERLGEARRALGAIAHWEPAAAEGLAELDELGARAAELGRALAERLSAIETEPGRLDGIEERLALVERLIRKYGEGSAGILARRVEIGRELAELEEDASNRGELEARAAAALDDYRAAALALSDARRRWGVALAARLEKELAELALKGTRFEVALERTRRAGSALVVDGEPVDFAPHGIDRVSFQFAPNPGEPMAPIARTASGGELARVSLALQLAAHGEEVAGGPTLVFDEADSGLGGAQGAALGRKLRRLARRGQILAVTHLAQVASFADCHHRVAKRVRSGRTWADVARLDRAERVAEIARMLSGAKVTGLSLEHAEEMVAAAEVERR